MTYFVLTERVWTHYFGGTKIVWTAVWTELLQFESVNVCFLWSCAGGDFTALLDVVLSSNDDTCQSIQVASSYVLLTVMRDWRLKPFKHMAQGETLWNCEELVYDTHLTSLFWSVVTVCNCWPATGQTVERDRPYQREKKNLLDRLWSANGKGIRLSVQKATGLRNLYLGQRPGRRP